MDRPADMKGELRQGAVDVIAISGALSDTAVYESTRPEPPEPLSRVGPGGWPKYAKSPDAAPFCERMGEEPSEPPESGACNSIDGTRQALSRLL